MKGYLLSGIEELEMLTKTVEVPGLVLVSVLANLTHVSCMALTQTGKELDEQLILDAVKSTLPKIFDQIEKEKAQYEDQLQLMEMMFKVGKKTDGA